MADPADLNLDELKRRGRRRLIGAIVLALVAAVVVPMLLESEPRPLGEDVSVRIPPVDDGKYVSKIVNDEADAARPATRPGRLRRRPLRSLPLHRLAAPAPATSASGDAAPRKSLADAEKTVLTPGTRPPAPEPKSPAKATEATKANNVAKAAEPAPPKGEPAAEGRRRRQGGRGAGHRGAPARGVRRCSSRRSPTTRARTRSRTS